MTAEKEYTGSGSHCLQTVLGLSNKWTAHFLAAGFNKVRPVCYHWWRFPFPSTEVYPGSTGQYHYVSELSFQPGGNLQVSQSFEAASRHKVAYFLRKKPGNISPGNINSMVTAGDINPTTFDQLSHFVQEVSSKFWILRSCDTGTSDWPNLYPLCICRIPNKLIRTIWGRVSMYSQEYMSSFQWHPSLDQYRYFDTLWLKKSYR